MVLDKLFGLMADKKASDLLLSPGACVTMKIHGLMVPVNQDVQLTGVQILRMLATVLTAEQMAVLEHEQDLNISIKRPNVGTFRMSAFKQTAGFAAVFRYISDSIQTLDALRLPATLKEVAMQQRGLVLICGATGSGKSTTIASMLEYRNLNRAGHILTIEDPIEHRFISKKSVINQRELLTDAPNLDAALRNGLRQSPDVIYIGENRDAQTLTAAMNYALSGHLVFTTLHANSSSHAISRILSMYPADSRAAVLSDLSACVRHIVTQRLVKATSGGRLPALEMMVNTQLTAELIERGKLVELREAMGSSIAQGSQTFEQSLMTFVNEGKITLEDALQASDSPSNLNWLLNNQGKPRSAGLEVLTATDQEPKGAQYKEFKFG